VSVNDPLPILPHDTPTRETNPQVAAVGNPCRKCNPLPKWARADSAFVHRTRFLQRTLWHSDTVCGMVRSWMPHWCWAGKVGW
jgi:hypothetical protein